MMKILVTGGAGFIGSHLVEALVDCGHQLFILDDFNDFYSPQIKRANIASFLPALTLFEVDICDQPRVKKTVLAAKPDLIIHLAARAGVRPSVLSPELYLQTNINGTFNLLEAAREAATPQFIFASSSSVYGSCQTIPFREDQVITQTLSPYASTKLAAEHLCSHYAYLYGMQVVCLRFFNVYGPRQRPDTAIYKFTDRIYRGRQIEVYGDGTARRDFTYVDDIVRGVLATINYKNVPFDIFNLGESEPIEVRAVIRKIEQSLDKEAIVKHLEPISGDMPQTYADISKARKLLNYTPTTRIEQGLPKFLEWYLRQPNQ